MRKHNIFFSVAKRLLFFSAPLVAFLYILYEVILGFKTGFSWIYAVFYASIIGISSGINYREGSIEEEVSSFKIMKEKIENGRW
ncbi:MAG: hypothetical protein RBT15_02045, partial [Gudongella sp.]|nr:hypothetical protein [Gudongella sp.]